MQDVQALQDALARAHPSGEAVTAAREAVLAATAALAPSAAPVDQRPYGLLRERPDRGSALSPPLHLSVLDERELRGEVRFSPFYVGGLGAVHGGALALVLDGAFGRLARQASGTLSRTAHLDVDFRRVAPLDRPLAVHAWLESTQGRKRLLRATVHDGEDLVTEGSALFVQLLAHHR